VRLQGRDDHPATLPVEPWVHRAGNLLGRPGHGAATSPTARPRHRPTIHGGTESGRSNCATGHAPSDADPRVLLHRRLLERSATMTMVRAAPRAAMLVESMRDVGYTLETALADIMDNAIAAGASHHQDSRRHARVTTARGCTRRRARDGPRRTNGSHATGQQGATSPERQR